MKSISIIIISYNEKIYLQECFDSILSQTIFDQVDLIIGDDGSTDGSVDFINDYFSSKNISYSLFQMERDNNPIIPSIRVSNIIKKGLSICNTEYALVISGDDKLLNINFLNDAKNILDQNHELSAAVSSGFEKFWNDGTTEQISNKSISPKFYWNAFYTHISCFLFRKNYVENYLLDRFCDDTGLEFSLACCGKWNYVNNYSFGYRQRDKSIMHEADNLELSILELLLMQDCLNTQHLKKQTYCRFYKPLLYAIKNSDSLQNPKYSKYFENAKKYKNDFLNLLLEYKKNKTSINLLLFKCRVSYLTFKIQDKLLNIVK